MKKIYLVILLALGCYTNSFSQNATPNAGFEEWDQIIIGDHSLLTPQSWNTLDSATGIIGVLTCLQTTDAHSGNYAAELLTKIIFGQVANGICTTGRLLLSPPYGEYGGIEYHDRPDSIAGWYKYFPAANDSTDIEFTLTSTTTNPVGYAQFKTGATVSQYSRFSVPITYYSSEDPDTARWLISGSNGFSAVENTVLYVDDLELDFATGIHDIQKISPIKITPLALSGILLVENTHNITATLSIFDEAGRNLQIFDLHNSSSEIDMNYLQNGFYFYSVKDDKGISILNGKFGVKK